MRKKHDLQFEDFASDTVATEELDYVEVPLSSRVFLLVIVTATLLAATMVARIIYLGGIKGSFYQARAIANINHEKLIPAHRGIITDRIGVVLAKNTETFSVFLNITELLKDRVQFDLVISALAQTLDMPVSDIEAAVADVNFENNTEVPVVRNITSEQAIAVRGLSLASVSVENDFRREYPLGASMSAILGYTGISDTGVSVIGKTGLEHYYDGDLKGTDGKYVYIRNVKGTVLDERVAQPATPGAKVKTTIDADFQQYFYNRLKQGLAGLGSKGGVGLAIDPRNGEILALVSLPSYDNNIFMTPGKSADRVRVVTDKDHPVFNRAVKGVYSPGSTIKPLVALSALHEKVIDPSFQLYSPGYLEIPNPYVPDKPSRFLDWRPQGWVNVRSALARSSNVFFYEVGGGLPSSPGVPAVVGLGIERLRHYWEKFGFGAKTGIDADNEAVGFLPSPDEKQQRTKTPWRIGDSYNVSIGQGDLQVSPIQLLNYIAGIANNGVMYAPHLVQSITGQRDIEPTTLIDYSDWKMELREVQAGMRDGVIKDYGTSHALNDLPMAVASKTGSAQIQFNTKTNAFFVGYGPFEKPRIAIEVLIENAKEGSLNAVPIAKDVLNWYYEHRIALRTTN